MRPNEALYVRPYCSPSRWTDRLQHASVWHLPPIAPVVASPTALARPSTYTPAPTSGEASAKRQQLLKSQLVAPVLIQTYPKPPRSLPVPQPLRTILASPIPSHATAGAIPSVNTLVRVLEVILLELAATDIQAVIFGRLALTLVSIENVPRLSKRGAGAGRQARLRIAAETSIIRIQGRCSHDGGRIDVGLLAVHPELGRSLTVGPVDGEKGAAYRHQATSTTARATARRLLHVSALGDHVVGLALPPSSEKAEAHNEQGEEHSSADRSADNDPFLVAVIATAGRARVAAGAVAIVEVGSG
jgi:hypothetical protein